MSLSCCAPARKTGFRRRWTCFKARPTQPTRQRPNTSFAGPCDVFMLFLRRQAPTKSEAGSVSLQCCETATPAGSSEERMRRHPPWWRLRLTLREKPVDRLHDQIRRLVAPFRRQEFGRVLRTRQIAELEQDGRNVRRLEDDEARRSVRILIQPRCHLPIIDQGARKDIAIGAGLAPSEIEQDVRNIGRVVFAVNAAGGIGSIFRIGKARRLGIGSTIGCRIDGCSRNTGAGIDQSSAWIEMNKAAFESRAMRTRSPSGTKTSVVRVMTTL